MTEFVDADGCDLRVGMTSWEPWRWGGANLCFKESQDARKTCRLSRGVRMRDPTDGDCLPRYHEIAYVKQVPA